MSQRDVLAELRTAHVEATPQLQARVRLIAARAPEPARGRRRFALALVLAPVAAAAVAAGVFVAVRPTHHQTAVHGYAAASGSSVLRAAAPAPSAKRAQQYGAALQLEVRDVQRTVTEAVHVVGSLSGFVVSVHIDTSTESGSAFLTLRVPRSHVQTAVARLSRLGKVTSEQVDIQDVQAGLNATDRLIARLRKELPNAAVKARIERLQRQRAAAVRAAHFATLRLSLSTPPVVPHKHHHYTRDALPWLGGAAAALVLLLALRGLARVREDRLLSRS